MTLMNKNKSEYWNNVIADFMASGLTQIEYSRKNNLKLHNLGYWIRKHILLLMALLKQKKQLLFLIILLKLKYLTIR